MHTRCLGIEIQRRGSNTRRGGILDFVNERKVGIERLLWSEVDVGSSLTSLYQKEHGLNVEIGFDYVFGETAL